MSDLYVSSHLATSAILRLPITRFFTQHGLNASALGRLRQAQPLSPPLTRTLNPTGSSKCGVKIYGVGIRREDVTELLVLISIVRNFSSKFSGVPHLSPLLYCFGDSAELPQIRFVIFMLG